MFSEFVLPDNNEVEFVEIALRLGLRKISFLYNFDEYSESRVQKRLSLINDLVEKINVEIGFIVNQKNLNKAIKKSNFLVAKSSSSDSDRFFIESGKLKMIYGFEENSKKDYLHQRASGLNHVFCSIAVKKNVAFGFSYSSLFDKNEQGRCVTLGRIIQNLSLCQKYDVKIVISSFAENPYDLRSFHDVISLFNLLGLNKGYIS